MRPPAISVHPTLGERQSGSAIDDHLYATDRRNAMPLEPSATAARASGSTIGSNDLFVTRPASQASRLFAAITLLGVLLSFFFALGRAPLFDVDEAAFSQATIEMFERGDFLSTYLNGEPYYDKPILVFWLQALSVKVFGVNEFAFRFPSAVCAAIWVLLTFLFARRRFGRNKALLAAGVMATSLGVYIIGRAGTTDALLNMLIAASMFAAWLHLETGKRRWLYAAFAAIGFGFLAKGPVAILIPVGVTFLFCLLRRDIRTWARAVFDYRGLLLFAAIALPWYLLILHREGWAFVQGFFLRHNVNNFLGTLQGHSGSALYYIPVVLIGTLPFTAFFVRAVVRVREAWRDDLQCYLWLWFGFVFVFFSLSGTKLPHYLLYGMTGMFVLIAVLRRRVAVAFPRISARSVFIDSPARSACHPRPRASEREGRLLPRGRGRRKRVLRAWVFGFCDAGGLAHRVFHAGAPLRHPSQARCQRNRRRRRPLRVRRAGGGGRAAGADQGSRAAGARQGLSGDHVAARCAQLQRLLRAPDGDSRAASRGHRHHESQAPV